MAVLQQRNSPIKGHIYTRINISMNIYIYMNSRNQSALLGKYDIIKSYLCEQKNREAVKLKRFISENKTYYSTHLKTVNLVLNNE